MTSRAGVKVRETEFKGNGQIRKWPVLLMLGFCLILGLSYLSSGLIPNKLDLGAPEALYSDLSSSRWEDIAEAGLTKNEVNEFLRSDLAKIQVGMVLYPRLYLQGEEYPVSSYIPDMPSDDQRLYFQMLTKDSPIHVYLPLQDTWVSNFPNAELALVIGCENPDHFQAKVFIPLDLDLGILIENPVHLTCNN
jgi:hypothetical protein